MISICGLRTVLIVSGLISSFFYSAATQEFGFKTIRASGAECLGSPSGSISIAVISNLNDSVHYKITGNSIAYDQVNNQGEATFSGLLPGNYTLNITNQTTGAPSLSAQVTIHAAPSVAITSVIINPPLTQGTKGMVTVQALAGSGLFTFFFNNIPEGEVILQVSQVGLCQSTDSMSAQIVSPAPKK